MEELGRIGDTKTCTSAVIIRNGKILLGLRHYTKDTWKEVSVWTTPGGRCDAGEILEHGLRRETEEETGITDLVVKEFIGTYPGSGGNGDIVYMFLCETRAEPMLMEPEKFSEWGWFPLDALPVPMISPHLVVALQRRFHLLPISNEGSEKVFPFVSEPRVIENNMRLSMMNFPQRITVTDQDIDLSEMSESQKQFVIEFTDELLALYREKGRERIVVGIAGPSGAGKSVLAVLASKVGGRIDPAIPIIPISIDAFHFPNNYLDGSRDTSGDTLKVHKGRYDTYDVGLCEEKLRQFLSGARTTFPLYSRALHDPIPDRILIEGPALLLFEGLWILSDKDAWGKLRIFFSKTYFLDGDPEKLRTQAIARHVRGGRTEENSTRFYDQHDAANAELVRQTRTAADTELRWPL